MSAAKRLEILEYCETPLGVLCLRRRELLSSPGTVITEVTLNHEFLMSSYHTESENALATRALDWHKGATLNVLVGGLGLGYTARAALADQRVKTVDVLELLPEVIAWIPRDLTPLARELRDETRFHVREEDIFRRLLGPPETRYDLVLIDVDHSPDELLDERNGAFYTEQGLACAREHLADDGILAVWSSAENEEFARALQCLFSEVKLETVQWQNELIDEDQRDDIFLARR